MQQELQPAAGNFRTHYARAANKPPTGQTTKPRAQDIAARLCGSNDIGTARHFIWMPVSWCKVQPLLVAITIGNKGTAASHCRIKPVLKRNIDPAADRSAMFQKRHHAAEAVDSLDEIASSIDGINCPRNRRCGTFANVRIDSAGLLADHFTIDQIPKPGGKESFSLAVSDGNKIRRAGFCLDITL